MESAFTRFSPDLVETPVIVHPIKPVDRPAPGLWIAVGHGRPYVPWDMPQHEVTREMALLREKVRRSRVFAALPARAAEIALCPPRAGRL